MTEIEKLMNSDEYFIGCYSFMLPIKEQVIEFAKAYAEQYAKRCLQIAAENAKTVRCPDYDEVNKQSITDITLPEHE